MDQIASLTKIEGIEKIAPKIILDVIEAERRKKAVLAGICKVDRTLVRTRGRSVHVPSVTALKAVDVEEGKDITGILAATVTWETVEITPKKIGTWFQVNSEQVRATEIDVVNAMIQDAGRAIGDKEDDKVAEAILAPGAAGSTVPTPTGTLTFEAVVNAKREVTGKKFSPNLIIVSPLRADELVKDATRFTDVAEIGREAIIEGAIGRYAGLDVLQSAALPDSTAIVLDRDAAPWFILRRDVDVRPEEVPAADATRYYVWKEFAVKVTQPDGLCHITF